MHFELVLLLLSSPLPTHALSLVDTLRNQAGASQFAQIIESNTELLALVQSNTLTVFAPTDKNSRLASLQRRDTDNQKDARQIQEGLTNIQSFSTKPGVVVKTEDRSGNLNGNPQAVVAHSGQFADPRFNLQNARIRRTIGNFTYEPVTISSGLGNNVSIIREDIPYDGGIIQVVNDYFTKPISLSATSIQTGNTQFASRLNRSNLTNLLDNTPSITAFIPSDAAFAAVGNYTKTSDQIASQLSNHIVTNQVLYLPRLVHGARYCTKAGNNITVTVQSGRYLINGAEISQPDLILENGVAHIINKVITPTASTTPTATSPIQFSSNGSKISVFNPTFVVIIIIAIAFLIPTYPKLLLAS